MLDRREIWVLLDDQIYESLRFPRNIMVPLEIPTPTPAPDQGGPLACLNGPEPYPNTYCV